MIMTQPLFENITWQDIRDEYLAIAEQAEPWMETELHNGKWEVFGLMFKGEKFQPNIDRCPKTWQLIQSIPRAYIAGFSVLKAGAIIHPHVGYTGEVLRSHLGLICPEKAWIKVGDTVHHWKEGEWFVFDDTIIHEAQNESDTDRVVLLVDFYKDEMSEQV